MLSLFLLFPLLSLFPPTLLLLFLLFLLLLLLWADGVVVAADEAGCQRAAAEQVLGGEGDGDDAGCDGGGDDCQGHYGEGHVACRLLQEGQGE